MSGTPTSNANRYGDLIRFYQLIDQLEERMGARILLQDCNSRMKWPMRGVYFFMEEGEFRSDSGSGLRIVRVGTHAHRGNAKTTLWSRLYAHKGRKNGGGNRRNSIFRRLVGESLTSGVWNKAATVNAFELEQQISGIIGKMPFLFLEIDDEDGNLRGHIERNSIALLSNCDREPKLDLPSGNWLGMSCPHNKIRSSGLWNQHHVKENHNPEFLDKLERLVKNANRFI